MTRTILLGLDGATFTVLDPLMRDGVMPRLRALMGRGVRAPLRTIVPALTPPAWTSLVTGRQPGAHGIFDFFRKDAPESPHFRFLTSRDVTAPTVWALANAGGHRTTVLNFPVTFPAPDLDGHVVPGGPMPWRQLRLGCRPAGLFDRLKAEAWFNPRELAMDMSHEARALEGCPEEEYEGWVEAHIRRERQWVNVLLAIASEDPAPFTSILLDGVDKIQHLCWRFLDPACASTVRSEWERRVREKCLDYFRELDTMIHEIVEAAGPETTTIVASDHGFGAQRRTFFVNAWLARHGYLTWAEGQAPQATGAGALGVGQMARHVYQIDWTRTRAYAPLPSGNGIHIVPRSDEYPGGVAPGEYQEFRDRLARQLLEVRDPESGTPVVAQVWTRDVIFEGPTKDLAPDLTLELEDGGLLSILDASVPVQRRPEPTGTHHPIGVFAAAGPGVRAGQTLDGLSILDVAPALLYSLDLPVPAGLDGRLPVECFTPERLAARPPRVGGAVAAARTGEGGEAPELDAEAESEILRRLQALGYVE